MTNTHKKIILAIVAILIIAAIVFIEAKKAPHISSGSAPNVTVAATNQQGRAAILAAKAAEYPMAKELVDPSGFINTPPFTLSSLIGKKVILVDFWTYSCINCQRTIPYLNAWYQKYKDSGLVIVGVHTPEFDFEKNISNVQAAVLKAGIKYPVVLDNNMGTWNAYDNQYWPNEYLIDIDGYVVHNHIGEGDYADTEKAIQAALQERNTVLGLTTPIPTGTVDPSNAISLDSDAVQSPETYFGAERNEYLGNGIQGQEGQQTLAAPSVSSLQPNTLYLDGTWDFQDQYAESVSPITHIEYAYSAKHVYMVASATKPVTLKISVDDTLYRTVTVQADQLYDLVDEPDYGAHTLQIEVDGAGLDAYTFTFG
jgi:thiol-disulfide isomerase/thioredoxin